jgi:hypothetical protein
MRIARWPRIPVKPHLEIVSRITIWFSSRSANLGAARAGSCPPGRRSSIMACAAHLSDVASRCPAMGCVRPFHWRARVPAGLAGPFFFNLFFESPREWFCLTVARTVPVHRRPFSRQCWPARKRFHFCEPKAVRRAGFLRKCESGPLHARGKDAGARGGSGGRMHWRESGSSLLARGVPPGKGCAGHQQCPVTWFLP